MDNWDLRALEVEPGRPVVLHSDEEGRAIALQLTAGTALDDHEVHERAWLIVIDGAIDVEAGPRTLRGGPGFLTTFGPRERHEVRAVEDTRLLLLLAPWPGEGRVMG